MPVRATRGGLRGIGSREPYPALGLAHSDWRDTVVRGAVNLFIFSGGREEGAGSMGFVPRRVTEAHRVARPRGVQIQATREQTVTGGKVNSRQNREPAEKLRTLMDSCRADS